MREEAIEGRSRRWRWTSLTGGGVLFQEDGFRRLWIGRVLSHTALNAVLYTLLVLAIGEGSGSSIKSALFITAYLLPTATLGTFSGVLVDRLPKNLVLTFVNVARVGLMLLLLMEGTSLPVVYGIALLIAITSQFASPAESASLPLVVRTDQLTMANSTNNFGALVSQILGFAVLPPLLLNTIGAGPLFLIAAVLFGASTGFFLLVRSLRTGPVTMADAASATQNVRKQFAEGWERLSQDMESYMSVIIIVLASAASLVAVTLMPRFAQDTLDIPAQNAIFVFLPAAIGIVAGLRLVQLLERWMPKAWLVGVGFVLLVVSFACLAFTVPFANILESANPLGVFDPGPFGETTARIVVTIMLSAVAAFSFSVLGVAGRSLVNERLPVEFQGRVFAAQVVLTNLASIPPILLAGFLSELLGVEPVMFLTMVILVGAAAWALARAMSRPQPLSHVETRNSTA